MRNHLNKSAIRESANAVKARLISYLLSANEVHKQIDLITILFKQTFHLNI